MILLYYEHEEQNISFFFTSFKNLMLELKNYEENQKAARMDRPSGLGELDQQQMGIIPVRSYFILSIHIFTHKSFKSNKYVIFQHVSVSFVFSHEFYVRIWSLLDLKTQNND